MCGELGAIAIKWPLPPSGMSTIWGADEAFVEKYFTTFPGYYESGDAGFKDEDGYVYIMARTDDVINVAGHRLSTGQLEEVLGLWRPFSQTYMQNTFLEPLPGDSHAPSSGLYRATA